MGGCSTSSVLPTNGGSGARPPRAIVRARFDSANVAVAARARGPTLESVLLDYAAMITNHDIVPSKYPLEVTMQLACTIKFSIPQPPAGFADGQQWHSGLHGLHIGPF